MSWDKAQSWETDWWGTCHNTLGEEWKQVLYAEKMGLKMFHDGKSPFNIDLNGRRVIDIGGGPASLLLKCTNFARATVVDPLPVPDWVEGRYELAGIELEVMRGEDISLRGYDEAWIYNVLQHTTHPRRVLENALQSARLLRIFEWIDTAVNEGHLHSFTKALLDKWLDGEGKVERLTGQHHCVGSCYYGIFPGRGK